MNLEKSITVCVPTIPPRAHLLSRAMSSISIQSLPATNVAVSYDTQKAGAAFTRTRALDMVTTPWCAFLDDDDEFHPEHLAVLAAAAHDTSADYVYSWFDVAGGTDPFPSNFGRPFDPADPVQTTITILVRTDLAREVGGFTRPRTGDNSTPDGNTSGEDFVFTLKCIDAGAKIVHAPIRSWTWHHDSSNTSGRPDRW